MKDIPDDYIWHRWMEGELFLECLTCGALTRMQGMYIHIEWHKSLDPNYITTKDDKLSVVNVSDYY